MDKIRSIISIVRNIFLRCSVRNTIKEVVLLFSQLDVETIKEYILSLGFGRNHLFPPYGFQSLAAPLCLLLTFATQVCLAVRGALLLDFPW